MKNMFLPKAMFGKLSVLLIILMPLLFWLGSFISRTHYVDISSGTSIIEDIIARPAVSFTMISGMLAGVSAFITGIWSILKQEERALSVYSSTVLGLLLILFLGAELIFQSH